MSVLETRISVAVTNGQNKYPESQSLPLAASHCIQSSCRFHKMSVNVSRDQVNVTRGQYVYPEGLSLLQEASKCI